MGGLTNLSRFSDSKYLAAVMTQAVLQSGPDVRAKSEAFDNTRVFRRWVDILHRHANAEIIVKEIRQSLLECGLTDNELNFVSPVLLRIVETRTKIVEEVKRQLVERDVPRVTTFSAFEEPSSTVNPLEPLDDDEKVLIIARELSWEIHNRLIDEKVRAGNASK